MTENGVSAAFDIRPRKGRRSPIDAVTGQP